MKVAIVGSRKFPDSRLVRRVVDLLPEDTIIVSGCGDGPDSWAEQEAKRIGYPLMLFPVRKNDLPPFPEGRREFAERAFARNTLIAETCDRLVAFWDGVSYGTKDTIDKARALGKDVTILCSDADSVINGTPIKAEGVKS